MIPRDLFNTFVPVDPLRDRFNALVDKVEDAGCREDAQDIVAERIAAWLGWGEDDHRQEDTTKGVLVLLGVTGDKYGAVRPTMKAIRAMQLGWLLGLKPSDVFDANVLEVTA